MINRPSGLIQTSVLISEEFFHLCKTHQIKFSEAMRVGIALMLAERGIGDYDNKLNISRKITLLQKQLEETAQELNSIKEKHG
jgi:hypothetical protein